MQELVAAGNDTQEVGGTPVMAFSMNEVNRPNFAEEKKNGQDSTGREC
jgi:hypothetical protein